jgi:hypothetical protein
MNVRDNTAETLAKCVSYKKRDGFRTEGEIRVFWERFGAIGFLNIKEITPDMVEEIRTNIIKPSQRSQRP